MSSVAHQHQRHPEGAWGFGGEKSTDQLKVPAMETQTHRKLPKRGLPSMISQRGTVATVELRRERLEGCLVGMQ